jgi:hypothetical protein
MRDDSKKGGSITLIKMYWAENVMLSDFPSHLKLSYVFTMKNLTSNPIKIPKKAIQEF